MALFDTRVSKVIDESNSIAISAAPAEIVNGASIKYFKSYLGDIRLNTHYHFWTGGQWHMHELIAYLLTITGEADVYITTWAISEDAVKFLLYLKTKGLIKNLKCVFDFKAKEQKTNAYLLAKTNFEVVLTKIHAKVTVIQNDNWKITITGSANWTRNPRAERQLICTVPEVALADISIIEKLLAGENPFKIRGHATV